MLNRTFPSSPGPLYQNEVTCSAFDVEMIFHSHANKTHFRKKGCALGLILKVSVFGTRKWPISFESCVKAYSSVFPVCFYFFFNLHGLVINILSRCERGISYSWFATTCHGGGGLVGDQYNKHYFKEFT